MININIRRFENIRNEKYFLFLVILINFILKGVTASLVDLGNDEVYYWTYAMFPDWSHFDHPPMVGLVIQLFSINLLLHSEFFIRLGALVLSSGSIVMLFYLVKKIYSVKAASIAVLLFTASLYFNIISGLFILPDTPLIFFILLALYYGIPSITSRAPSKEDHSNIIMFGFFTGLALLSKYTAFFVWFGFGLYILMFNRIWLKNRSLYLSILLSLFLMTPVIYWNIVNHFVSFSFHASRVGLSHNTIHNSSFLEFNLGEILYQNPILFVIFILALFYLFRNAKTKLKEVNILLLYLSIPLILTSVLFSLFMNVLPHWSGPAFIGLIILSSEWLSNVHQYNASKVYQLVAGANILFLVVILLVFLQIDFGILYTSPRERDVNKTGEHDPSLDMYGWKQAEVKFHEFLHKEGIKDQEFKHVKILSNKWFPAAHLDYYIAQPLHIDLLVTGKLQDAHKYFWINQKRNITQDDKLYYITSSQDYYDPEALSIKFRTIIPNDTIRIIRNRKIVKDLFIYEMRDPSGENSFMSEKPISK